MKAVDFKQQEVDSFNEKYPESQGFPSGSTVKNLLAMQEAQEMQVRSLGREDALEEEMANTPVFLPGKFHGQSLVGYSPCGHRVRLD